LRAYGTPGQAGQAGFRACRLPLGFASLTPAKTAQIVKDLYGPQSARSPWGDGAHLPATEKATKSNL